MELLLVLAGGVNRLVEVIKNAFLVNADLSEEVKKALLVALSLVLGVIAAFGAGVTVSELFPGIALLDRIPPLVGTIALGLLIGAGANAIHAVVDFIETVRGRVEIQEAVITVEPTVTVTTTASPSLREKMESGKRTWTSTEVIDPDSKAVG